jgi:hypothetical protein
VPFPVLRQSAFFRIWKFWPFYQGLSATTASAQANHIARDTAPANSQLIQSRSDIWRSSNCRAACSVQVQVIGHSQRRSETPVRKKSCAIYIAALKTKLISLLSFAPMVIVCVAVPSFSCHALMV